MIHRGVEMKIESITVATTLQLWISHYVARETQFPKCGKTTENVAISNDSTVASGTITELRTVFRPATTDTVVTSVTAQSPTDTGEIFDSITVAQITTTKLVSGEDS